MTVPLELSLRSTQAGPRLFFYPVHELETLRTGCIIDREKLSVDQANSLLSQVTDELLDLNLVIHANDRIVLDLRGHSLTIDPAQYLVEFQGIQGAIASTDHPISIRVLIDRAVTEIFINQGEAAFSAMTLPAGDQTLSLNGPANILKLQVYALHSIW
jgi:sucrose-6-phosphate hydrolase SacC (GH32 family)